jgi:DNA-binding beta-propeller fold protein YncE
VVLANFGSNTISLVDLASSREVVQIPVCRGAVDVTAASYRGSELGYVACYGAGTVGVVDFEKKRSIQDIPVGEKPFGIAGRPQSSRVYVCVGGSNRLAVLDGDYPSRIVRRIAVPGTPL